MSGAHPEREGDGGLNVSPVRIANPISSKTLCLELTLNGREMADSMSLRCASWRRLSTQRATKRNPGYRSCLRSRAFRTCLAFFDTYRSGSFAMYAFLFWSYCSPSRHSCQNDTHDVQPVSSYTFFCSARFAHPACSSCRATLTYALFLEKYALLVSSYCSQGLHQLSD